MSTQADQLGERVIVTGRAYVRMIEAADVLLDHRPVWTERVLLRLVRALTFLQARRDERRRGWARRIGAGRRQFRRVQSRVNADGAGTQARGQQLGVHKIHNTRSNKSVKSALLVSSSCVLIGLASSACTPATPIASPATVAAAASSPSPVATYRAPTYAEITPGPPKSVGDLSTTIDVPPFAYSQPLPPPEPSVLDGLYTRTIPFEGTPTPCKRCAGYRLEGGVWSLYLDKGVFKVFQQDTDFEAIGSFVVSGDRVTFFNDPYCEEDLTMVGTYTWHTDGDVLTLQVVNDACSIGLRSKNLTATAWTKKVDPCQPPNWEAVVTHHWKKPPGCDHPE